MTNEEVKAFWLKHDKRPRVQARRHTGWVKYQNQWVDCSRNILFDFAICDYRIHPEDLEKFMSIEKEKPMKTIDITKPVMFRNFPSETVEIRGTLNKGHTQQLLLVVTDENGIQFESSRYIDGRVFNDREHARDIINVPERAEKFINVYDNHLCRSATLDFPGHENFHGTVKLIYEGGKLVSAEVVK